MPRRRVCPSESEHDKWWELHTKHSLTPRRIAERFGATRSNVDKYLRSRRKSEGITAPPDPEAVGMPELKGRFMADYSIRDPFFKDQYPN